MIIYVCAVHVPLIDRGEYGAEAEWETLQEASSSTLPHLQVRKKSQECKITCPVHIILSFIHFHAKYLYVFSLIACGNTHPCRDSICPGSLWSCSVLGHWSNPLPHRPSHPSLWSQAEQPISARTPKHQVPQLDLGSISECLSSPTFHPHFVLF